MPMLKLLRPLQAKKKAKKNKLLRPHEYCLLVVAGLLIANSCKPFVICGLGKMFHFNSFFVRVYFYHIIFAVFIMLTTITLNFLM